MRANVRDDVTLPQDMSTFQMRKRLVQASMLQETLGLRNLGGESLFQSSVHSSTHLTSFIGQPHLGGHLSSCDTICLRRRDIALKLRQLCRRAAPTIAVAQDLQGWRRGVQEGKPQLEDALVALSALEYELASEV